MKISQVQWYAAYTFPKFEKKVHLELVRRNIEVYLPLQKVFRQWSDRIKKIEVPLFPNYIFIKTADFERRDLVRIHGISNFVSFESKPAKISDEDIATIKKLESENLEVEHTLVEGTLVKVIRGPLAGLRGRLYSRKGKFRFGVRIDTIKQSLSVEIPAAYLEKA
jgi:transcription antitermination factor NusG